MLLYEWTKYIRLGVFFLDTFAEHKFILRNELTRQTLSCRETLLKIGIGGEGRKFRVVCIFQYRIIKKEKEKIVIQIKIKIFRVRI